MGIKVLKRADRCIDDGILDGCRLCVELEELINQHTWNSRRIGTDETASHLCISQERNGARTGQGWWRRGDG